ncbi:MAG: glycosyltransferase family 2 protein [Steroidobacteraceae bacterium]
MRTSLVIVTYERPGALERVLASVAAQTLAPDEIIVADDGSGPAVATMVEAFRERLPSRVDFVRQEHAGFRAGRVRNMAIAHCTGDYTLLLDGDMVLHPHFVADHVRAARPGHWTQGVRIPLDEAATQRLLSGGCVPSPWTAGVDLRRRPYALHAPRLTARLGRAANAFVAVKSCNQAFWRADLLQANGFDEDFAGWGSEDKELCARLANAGIRRQTLVFAAIAWHLAHRPASRAAVRANQERWQETVRSGRTRCARGIDQHFTHLNSRG